MIELGQMKNKIENLISNSMKRKEAIKINPYDLNRLGVGFNQPCFKCELKIDRRSSPYQPIGFKKYCKCNH